MHGNHMAETRFVDTIPREVLGKPNESGKRLIPQAFPISIRGIGAAQ
jgi:hypothetical protein